MPTCCTCKTEKDTSCFGKDIHVKGGISHRCKECKNASTRIWNTTHKQYLRDKQIRWKKANPEWYKERAQLYAKTNGDSIRAYKRVYEKERRLTDISFRLIKNIRTRTADVLRGKIKSGSAIKDLGCSAEYLRLYLEQRWDKTMTWDCYGSGKYKWNIDHIIPLDYFDLEDPFQFKMAANYLNYQPMWQKDNHAKHASLPINFKDQLAVLYHIVERNNSELSTMFPNPAYDSLPAAA